MDNFYRYFLITFSCEGYNYRQQVLVYASTFTEAMKKIKKSKRYKNPCSFGDLTIT